MRLARRRLRAAPHALPAIAAAAALVAGQHAVAVARAVAAAVAAAAAAAAAVAAVFRARVAAAAAVARPAALVAARGPAAAHVGAGPAALVVARASAAAVVAHAVAAAGIAAVGAAPAAGAFAAGARPGVAAGARAARVAVARCFAGSGLPAGLCLHAAPLALFDHLSAAARCQPLAALVNHPGQAQLLRILGACVWRRAQRKSCTASCRAMLQCECVLYSAALYTYSSLPLPARCEQHCTWPHPRAGATLPVQALLTERTVETCSARCAPPGPGW